MASAVDQYMLGFNLDVKPALEAIRTVRDKAKELDTAFQGFSIKKINVPESVIRKTTRELQRQLNAQEFSIKVNEIKPVSQQVMTQFLRTLNDSIHLKVASISVPQSVINNLNKQINEGIEIKVQAPRVRRTRVQEQEIPAPAPMTTTQQLRRFREPGGQPSYYSEKQFGNVGSNRSGNVFGVQKELKQLSDLYKSITRQVLVIKEATDFNSGQMGSYSQGVIKIRTDIDRTKKNVVLIHEAVHAVLDNLGKTTAEVLANMGQDRRFAGVGQFIRQSGAKAIKAADELVEFIQNRYVELGKLPTVKQVQSQSSFKRLSASTIQGYLRGFNEFTEQTSFRVQESMQPRVRQQAQAIRRSGREIAGMLPKGTSKHEIAMFEADAREFITTVAGLVVKARENFKIGTKGLATSIGTIWQQDLNELAKLGDKIDFSTTEGMGQLLQRIQTELKNVSRGKAGAGISRLVSNYDPVQSILQDLSGILDDEGKPIPGLTEAFARKFAGFSDDIKNKLLKILNSTIDQLQQQNLFAGLQVSAHNIQNPAFRKKMQEQLTKVTENLNPIDFDQLANEARAISRQSRGAVRNIGRTRGVMAWNPDFVRDNMDQSLDVARSGQDRIQAINAEIRQKRQAYQQLKPLADNIEAIKAADPTMGTEIEARLRSLPAQISELKNIREDITNNVRKIANTVAEQMKDINGAISPEVIAMQHTGGERTVSQLRSDMYQSLRAGQRFKTGGLYRNIFQAGRQQTPDELIEYQRQLDLQKGVDYWMSQERQLRDPKGLKLFDNYLKANKQVSQFDVELGPQTDAIKNQQQTFNTLISQGMTPTRQSIYGASDSLRDAAEGIRTLDKAIEAREKVFKEASRFAGHEEELLAIDPKLNDPRIVTEISQSLQGLPSEIQTLQDKKKQMVDQVRDLARTLIKELEAKGEEVSTELRVMEATGGTRSVEEVRKEAKARMDRKEIPAPGSLMEHMYRERERKKPAIPTFEEQIGRNQQRLQELLDVTSVTGHSKRLNLRVHSETDKGSELINEQYYVKAGRVISVVGDQMKRSHTLLNSINGELTHAMGKIVNWALATGAVYGTLRAIRQAHQTIVDFEREMYGLRSVLNPAISDFEKLGDAALQIGQQYGQSVIGVANAMTEFARQGLQANELIHATGSAMMLANVAFISQADAAKAITTVHKQMQIAFSQSESVIDKLTAVSDAFAVSLSDLTTGLGRTGSAGKTFGVELDELIAMIATVGEATQRSGREVGTALRTVFARGVSPEAERIFKTLGIDIKNSAGEVRSFTDIIGLLSEKWDSINDIQRIDIAQALGGKMRINEVLSLLDNYDNYTRALEISQNASGTAAAKNATIMASFAKQVDVTRASIESLVVTMGEGGLLAAFKAANSLLQGLVKSVQAMDSITGGFASGALGLGFAGAGGAAGLISIAQLLGMGDRVSPGIHRSGDPMQIAATLRKSMGGNPAAVGVPLQTMPTYGKRISGIMNFIAGQQNVQAAAAAMPVQNSPVGPTIVRANAANALAGSSGIVNTARSSLARTVGSFLAVGAGMVQFLVYIAAAGAALMAITKIWETMTTTTQELAEAERENVTTSRQHTDAIKQVILGNSKLTLQEGQVGIRSGEIIGQQDISNLASSLAQIEDLVSGGRLAGRYLDAENTGNGNFKLGISGVGGSNTLEARLNSILEEQRRQTVSAQVNVLRQFSNRNDTNPLRRMFTRLGGISGEGFETTDFETSASRKAIQALNSGDVVAYSDSLQEVNAELTAFQNQITALTSLQGFKISDIAGDPRMATVFKTYAEYAAALSRNANVLIKDVDKLKVGFRQFAIQELQSQGINRFETGDLMTSRDITREVRRDVFFQDANNPQASQVSEFSSNIIYAFGQTKNATGDLVDTTGSLEGLYAGIKDRAVGFRNALDDQNASMVYFVRTGKDSVEVYNELGEKINLTAEEQQNLVVYANQAAQAFETQITAAETLQRALEGVVARIKDMGDVIRTSLMGNQNFTADLDNLQRLRGFSTSQESSRARQLAYEEMTIAANLQVPGDKENNYNVQERRDFATGLLTYLSGGQPTSQFRQDAGVSELNKGMQEVSARLQRFGQEASESRLDRNSPEFQTQLRLIIQDFAQIQQNREQVIGAARGRSTALGQAAEGLFEAYSRQIATQIAVLAPPERQAKMQPSPEDPTKMIPVTDAEGNIQYQETINDKSSVGEILEQLGVLNSRNPADKEFLDLFAQYTRGDTLLSSVATTGKGAGEAKIDVTSIDEIIANAANQTQEFMKALEDIATEFAQNYERFTQRRLQEVERLSNLSETLSSPETLIVPEMAGIRGMAGEFATSLNTIVAAMVNTKMVDPQSVSATVKALEDTIAMNRRLREISTGLAAGGVEGSVGGLGVSAMGLFREQLEANRKAAAAAQMEIRTTKQSRANLMAQGVRTPEDQRNLQMMNATIAKATRTREENIAAFNPSNPETAASLRRTMLEARNIAIGAAASQGDLLVQSEAGRTAGMEENILRAASAAAQKIMNASTPEARSAALADNAFTDALRVDPNGLMQKYFGPGIQMIQDMLTGLANRDLVMQQAERNIIEAKEIRAGSLYVQDMPGLADTIRLAMATGQLVPENLVSANPRMVRMSEEQRALMILQNQSVDAQTRAQMIGRGVTAEQVANWNPLRPENYVQTNPRMIPKTSGDVAREFGLLAAQRAEEQARNEQVTNEQLKERMKLFGEFFAQFDKTRPIFRDATSADIPINIGAGANYGAVTPPVNTGGIQIAQEIDKYKELVESLSRVLPKEDSDALVAKYALAVSQSESPEAWQNNQAKETMSELRSMIQGYYNEDIANAQITSNGSTVVNAGTVVVNGGVTPPVAPTGAPRRHAGSIGYDEYVAILRRDEAVIPGDLVNQIPRGVLDRLPKHHSGKAPNTVPYQNAIEHDKNSLKEIQAQIRVLEKRINSEGGKSITGTDIISGVKSRMADREVAPLVREKNNLLQTVNSISKRIAENESHIVNMNRRNQLMRPDVANREVLAQYEAGGGVLGQIQRRNRTSQFYQITEQQQPSGNTLTQHWQNNRPTPRQGLYDNYQKAPMPSISSNDPVAQDYMRRQAFWGNVEAQRAYVTQLDQGLDYVRNAAGQAEGLRYRKAQAGASQEEMDKINAYIRRTDELVAFYRNAKSQYFTSARTVPGAFGTNEYMAVLRKDEAVIPHHLTSQIPSSVMQRLPRHHNGKAPNVIPYQNAIEHDKNTIKELTNQVNILNQKIDNEGKKSVQGDGIVAGVKSRMAAREVAPLERQRDSLLETIDSFSKRIAENEGRVADINRRNQLMTPAPADQAALDRYGAGGGVLGQARARRYNLPSERVMTSHWEANRPARRPGLYDDYQQAKRPMVSYNDPVAQDYQRRKAFWTNPQAQKAYVSQLDTNSSYVRNAAIQAEQLRFQKTQAGAPAEEIAKINAYLQQADQLLSQYQNAKAQYMASAQTVPGAFGNNTPINTPAVGGYRASMNEAVVNNLGSLKSNSPTASVATNGTNTLSSEAATSLNNMIRDLRDVIISTGEKTNIALGGDNTMNPLNTLVDMFAQFIAKQESQGTNNIVVDKLQQLIDMSANGALVAQTAHGDASTNGTMTGGPVEVRLSGIPQQNEMTVRVEATSINDAVTNAVVTLIQNNPSIITNAIKNRPML